MFKYNPAVILQQSEFFVIYNFILDYIIANGHTGTSVVSGKAARQTSATDRLNIDIKRDAVKASLFCR
ncbi:MAG: hypothetical protein IJD80_03595 [Oscillospiraceae bacterium]|nr:hypothetical protein [Oscillospiraceae bacterium]